MQALDKERYDALRAQLELRPSAAWNTLTLLGNAALLALAACLLRSRTTAGYVGAQLLLPIAWFQAFSILHDCGHGSFSSRRAVNTIVGHWASLFCFLPFYSWKYVHTEHHVWAGNAERDPGLSLVRRARKDGKLPRLLELCWRVWLPLGGLFQHFVYWLHPLTAFRRGTLSGPRLARALGSVLFLAGSYALLAHAAETLVTFRNLGPALLLYLMMVELVNIPHHVGLTTRDDRLPLREQHLPTRSCDYPPVLSELLVLNFNFHIEHHMFPTLPWYRLRAARRLLRPALGESYRQTKGLAWHGRERRRALVDVLRS